MVTISCTIDFTRMRRNRLEAALGVQAGEAEPVTKGKKISSADRDTMAAYKFLAKAGVFKAMPGRTMKNWDHSFLDAKVREA